MSRTIRWRLRLVPWTSLLALLMVLVLGSAGPKPSASGAGQEPAPQAAAEPPANDDSPAEPPAGEDDDEAEMRRLRERAKASTRPQTPDEAPADAAPSPPPVTPPTALPPAATVATRPARTPARPRPGLPKPAAGPELPFVGPPAPPAGGGEPGPTSAPTTGAAVTTTQAAGRKVYRFNYADTPWKDVLDDFARISGLSLVGDLKSISDNLTYRSSKDFDYEGALFQLNELLLLRPTNKMLLQRDENQLVIARLPDAIREIPPKYMFSTVKEFEAAALPDHLMSLVVYQPPAGWPPVEIIEQFRPRFPDYYGTQVWGDSIILTGMARDHRRFIEVVQRFIDLNPTPPTGELPWHTLALKNSKSSEVQNILRQLYPAGTPRQPRPGQDPDAERYKQVTIVADVQNNAILLKAPPQTVLEIKEMVQQLDAQTRSGEDETRVFVLEHAGADEVANALRPIQQAEQQQAKGAAGPYVPPAEAAAKAWNIFPQIGGNIIVAVGGPKGLARVEELIKAFDVQTQMSKPVRFALQHAVAAELAPLLGQTFRVQGKGRQPPVFTASNSDNSVVASNVTEQQLNEVRELIAALDQESPVTEHEHIVKLERAVPTEVAAALTQLAAPTPGPGKRVAQSISKFIGNDPSGTLMVRCDDKDWPRFELLIKDIDQQAAESELSMRTFVLGHADPSAVVAILQPMFAGAPQKRGQPAPRVFFTADDRNRSVRVAATAEVLERVAPMVAELDIASDVGRVRTIRLQKAKAEEVAPLLMQVFAGPGGAAIKPAAPGGLAPTTIKITAEPFTNALLVVAPPSEYGQIEKLALEMDAGADTKLAMRIPVPVQNRPAAEVAEVVKSLSTGPAAGKGAPAIGPALRAVAAGDQVILDGPRDEVLKAIELVRAVDVPLSSRQVKIYPVTDAEQVAEALGALMSGASAAPAAGGAPGAKPRPLAGTTTVYADTYKNVLIVNAMPADLPQIDMLVEAIEKDVELPEGQEPPSGSWHFFTLTYADAYDIALALEDLLEGPKGKPGPKFEVGPDDRILMVQCKPRELPEIEQMVKAFDIPEKGSMVASGLASRMLKPGMSPNETANRLAEIVRSRTGLQVRVNTTDVTGIEVIDIHADEAPARPASDHPAPSTQPAAMGIGGPGGAPLALLVAIQASLLGQSPATVDPATSAAPPVIDPNRTVVQSDPSVKEVEISVLADGRLLIKAPPDMVTDIEIMLDDLEKEAQQKVIKVFPIRYHGNVVDLGQTLERIFNGAVSRPVAPMQQMAQPPPQQPAARGGKEGEAAAGAGAAQQPRDRRTRAGAAAAVEQRIQVTPDTRTRQLIIAAVPADFPLIIAVLKQLDVEQGGTQNMRMFKLVNLDAAETARNLQDILGLNAQRGRGQQPGQGGDARRLALQQAEQARRAQQEGQPPPEQGGQQPGEEQGVIASAETTTITAIEQTNTIVASAPSGTLKLIENIINELELQPNETKPVMKRIQLVNARATELSTVIRDVATATAGGGGGARGGRGGPGGGGGGRAATPVSVNPETRTNSIILAGPSGEVERVGQIVKEFDVESKGAGEVEIISVKGDAKEIAAALKTVFADAKGATDVVITPDSSTGTIIMKGPQKTRAEIKAKITEMESKIVEAAKFRTIQLGLADADIVAKKLMEIFAEKGTRGGKQMVKVVAVKSSKSIIVQAPDDLFPEIEKHAKAMDTAPIELDIRSFKLKHAKATEVVDKMRDLLAQAMASMARSGDSGAMSLGTFAFTPDPLTNSLIVTGNPVTFLVVQKILDAVDVEQSEVTKRYVQSYVLNRNVQAQQIVGNIAALFAGINAKDGILPPSVTAEPNTNMVLITATEAQHKDILEKIIKPITDVVAQEAKEYSLVLQYAKADDAANVLNAFFNSWRAARGNRPQDNVTVAADVNSNTLQVSCAEHVKKVLDERLASIDVPPPPRATRTFAMKYAYPWEVANVINQQLNPPGKNPNDKVIASHEGGSLTLIVTANEKSMVEVERLVASLDTPGALTKDTRIIKLQKARADEAANVLNQMWQARSKPDRQGRWPVVVTPDFVGNQLFVTSSEEDFKITVAMAGELDVEPPGESAKETRSYRVRYADPNAVVNAINVSYQPSPGRSLSPLDLVRATADWATGSVIVNATGKKHEEIARLVAEMDVLSDASRTSHVIEIVNSDARDVAQALNTIYSQKTRGRTGIQPVTVSAMQGSTKIIVNCNDTELTEISELVKQIDQGGDKYGGRSVHTVAMPDHVPAKGIAEQINKIFTGQGYGGQGVKAEANAPTNTLLVFATAQEFQKINTEVIEKLSIVPPVGEVNIYRVPLKYASADEVAKTLSDFFDKMKGLKKEARPWWDDRGGGGGATEAALEDRVTITAEAASNMLIIACTEATKKKIDDLLADIDTDALPGGQNVLEMFALKYMDAADMIGILEEYLKLSRRTPTEDPQAGVPWWARDDSQKKSDEKVVLAGDMRLKAVEATNAIIVVGKPDAMPHVRELVAKLDVPVDNPAASPRMIQLVNANATQLAPTLEKLFSDSGQSRSSAPGYARMKPVIVADSATNILIVRAGAADFTVIERMVAEFDRSMTSEPGGVQIISLPTGLDVVDLAETVQKTINDAEKHKQSQIRDYRPDMVTINADIRTNSLVVAGSKAKFEEVSRLVGQLAMLGPSVGSSSVGFIPVKRANPEDVKRLIDELQQKRKSGTRGDATWKRQPKLRGAARPGPMRREPLAGIGVPARFGPLASAVMLTALAQAAPPRVTTVRPQAATQPAFPSVVRIEGPPTTTSPSGAVTAQLSGAPLTIQTGPNGLIVFGNEQDLATIRQLVDLLDTEVANLQIEYIELKNAQAVSLAKSLTDVYAKLTEGRGGSQKRPEDQVAFIADPRTNGLFIAAAGAKMAEVLDLVKRSDLKSSITQKNISTYVLKNRRVRDVEPNVKKVIQMWLKQKGITEQGTIDTAMDEQTNSLIVTAGEQDLAEVLKLIEQLDRPPPSEEDGDTTVTFGEASIMIVPLRVATADKLAPALTKLIQDSSTGKTPTNDFIRKLRVLDDRGEPIASISLDGPTFVVGDPESNSLVVASSRKNLLVMKEIIKRFDVEPLRDAIDLQVRVLKYADAGEIAEQVTKMLTDAKKLTNRPGGSGSASGVPETPAGSLVYDAVVTPDARTNTIILAGKPDAMTVIGDVITKLDVPGQAVMPIEIVKLAYASAGMLETVIDDLMKKRLEAMPKGTGANAGKAETVIIKADPRAETLIVSARADRLREVRELVTKLDIPATALVENIRPITLKNGNAADLATKIADLWSKRASQKETGGAKLEQPVLVADERSNSLIVAASKGDFDAIKALVDKLEALPFGPIADIRLIQLRFNSAKDLAPVFSKLFEERAQQREGVDGKVRPTDKVAIDADAVTNTLLVACSQENYDLLLARVKELDVEASVSGAIELFTLKNVEAARAKKTLDDIFKEGLYKPGAATDSAAAKEREKVVISTDDRSNTLLVTASPENMSIVRKIVQQMEDVRTPWNLSNTRIFELQHADAVRLGAQLQDYFEKTDKAQTTGERKAVDLPVTIIADERTNRLLVGASPDGIARAESLIQRLDVPPHPSTVIEVYRLGDGSAGKIGPMIDKMFEERNQPRGGSGSGGGSAAAAIPVTIEVDESSNALVISAAREDHVLIKNLLEMLDRRSNILEQVKLFALKKARASAVKEILEGLYRSGTGSSGRTGGGSSSTSSTSGAMPVAVTIDNRTNAVVVAGPPGELENIAKLVERLDSAEPIDEAQIAIFPLENADADKTSELLKEVLEGGTRVGGGGGGTTGGSGGSAEDNVRSALLSFARRDPRGEELFFKTIRENVQVSFDERTNSVIVVAPPPTVQLLKNLVKTLDEFKKRDVFVRVFMLRNADAAKTVELLESIFAQDEGSSQQAEFQQGRQIQVEGGRTGSSATPTASSQGGVSGKGTFGKPKTTFTSDSRTNSVVVAGWPEDIDVAGDIIDQLDSQDVRDRITQVIQLQNAVAEEVVTALDDFFQKEADRNSRMGEGLSEARKAEMEVSAVAHVETNQVLLSYSPRYQAQVLDVVRQLDTPPPQVMIQALLAEVTLDDRFEMGLEFALQELRFSETAVAGPNGTLQSSHFDVVGGTDLGAAASSGGLGGFAFTITGEDFNFLFRALQADSKLEVLQRPMIMCQDNQEASIIVGQEVPFLRGTQVTDNGQVNSQIEYQDIGVQLDVKPHINPDGFVYLEVKPEISQITPSTINVGNGITAPIFSKRNAETTVVVKDGETVVIGGLITTTDQESESKVPILGDVPGIGTLFRTMNKTKNRTELLIVLTPRVVRTVEDARLLSLESRDVTSVLTEDQKQSVLMGGLRVTPESERLDEEDLAEPVIDAPEQPPRWNMDIKLKPVPSKPGDEPAEYGPAAPVYGPFSPLSSAVSRDAGASGVADSPGRAPSAPSEVWSPPARPSSPVMSSPVQRLTAPQELQAVETVVPQPVR